MVKRAIVALSVWLAASACNHPGGGSPTSPATVLVVGLRLIGNTNLTTIGETGQLAATAVYSDGSTKDVTAVARWSSTDPSVVAVSSSGLMTVLRFGASFVSASYQEVANTAATSVPVRPAPSGMFIINGRVRDPGVGGIPMVTVTDTATLSSVQTESNGDYLLLLPTSVARLTFAKNGYEPTEQEATLNSADVAMQQLIRLHGGEMISPGRFAPHDFTYVIGRETCSPCRLVRLEAESAGLFQLRVTTNPPAILNVWANRYFMTGSSGELLADIPVPIGESIVYLGFRLSAGQLVGSAHVPFTIEAAFVSDHATSPSRRVLTRR